MIRNFGVFISDSGMPKSAVTPRLMDNWIYEEAATSETGVDEHFYDDYFS